jgi:hypothetical protein
VGTSGREGAATGGISPTGDSTVFSGDVDGCVT